MVPERQMANGNLKVFAALGGAGMWECVCGGGYSNSNDQSFRQSPW